VLFHYIGATVGELILMGVILRVTASWDLKIGFLCVSAIILAMTIILAFSIREVKPELRIDKDDFREAPSTFCEKFAFTLKRLWQVLKSDSKYIYCLLKYMSV
jgi:hypothetical protein